MSRGGPFTHITNQGIQDKILMAMDQLKQRIYEIGQRNLEIMMTDKRNEGKSKEELLQQQKDWMPTLAAIEQTHIVYINSSFKPFVSIAHEYSRTEPQGKPELSTSTTKFHFTLPIIGEFINDAVLHIKLNNFAAVSALDKVRYAEWLGHKIIKTVRFRIQNHVFDEYGTDEYTAYYQYKVPQHKEIGYKRCVGQEIPNQAFLTAEPTTDEFREYRWFGDGPQTFKQTHSDVELWIPMLFWFKDIQTSIPNFLLPKNETDIEIELESYSNLVAYSDNGGGGSFTPPNIADCAMYLNHLYVPPSISKIFVAKYSFQLIRVHRMQQRSNPPELTQSEGSYRLHDIKWPVECLYVGFRPKSNLSHTHKWHRNTQITETGIYVPVSDSQATPPPPPGLKFNQAVYYTEVDCVSKLRLTAHDHDLYPSISPTFYNAYIPLQHGDFLKTPSAKGWYMFNFNVKPGQYQPSGHFNVSRSRELYLHWTSALDTNSNYIIRSANPVELLVMADCINFLMFMNGTAALKYST